MKLERSRCIGSGWECSSAHSLTRPQGCLIIPEKAFSLDDLGGLYVVRVDIWHGCESFFPLAWLSFGFHLRAVFLGAKCDIIPRQFCSNGVGTSVLGPWGRE